MTALAIDTTGTLLAIDTTGTLFGVAPSDTVEIQLPPTGRLGPGIRLHDPQATLDYGMPWAALGLFDADDVIASSSWILTDAAGTPIDGAIVRALRTTTVAIVWIGPGLTAGASYSLTNHVVSRDGRQDDRTIVLRCRQR